MYAAFFGLSRDPFSIAPDPGCVFPSERHREALAHLLYGLSGGGGFVLLTGEIGAGKTTVCRVFLEQLPQSCNVAYIFNPRLSALELLQTVCAEFHVELPQGVTASAREHIDALNRFLLTAHAAGRSNLLVIDEAQNLSADVLEQLRLLTNLETESSKLLRIVLVGQPELREMLAQPRLEQLAQRVIARYHLGPLEPAQTEHYVRHRMTAAGLAPTQPLPFSKSALRRVHQLARGVPRRVNLLCDRALLGAFAHRRNQVDTLMVEQAAREVFDQRKPRSRIAWVWALGLATAGAAAGVAVYVVVARPEPFDILVKGIVAPALPPVAAAASTAATLPARVDGGIAPVLAAASRPAVSGSSAAAPDARAPVLLSELGSAWVELSNLWGVSVPAQADACTTLLREGLACFTRQAISLALIRQLGRPGVLTLDPRSARPSYALLVGLTDDSATLRADGTQQTVTLMALATRWQGEFSTLYRLPPGAAGRGPRPEEGAAATAWVAAQLGVTAVGPQAGTAVPDAGALREAVRHFQRAQGLPITGTLTPVTYMQINRVAGVSEPRLRTQR